MSITTDKSNPNLHSKDEITGQNKAYLVLSDEERAKGFVRPLRTSYVHTGKKINGLVKARPLNEEELNNKTITESGWVAFMEINDPTNPGLAGTYITQEEFDKLEDGVIKGCGALTIMAQPIAETYARDPKFYGSTWCMGCKEHLSVKEFTWDNTNETVGS